MTKKQAHIPGQSAFLNKEAIREEYNQKFPIMSALRDEAAFIISEAISEKKLKIHGIEKRVKELDSITSKCEDKNVKNPFEVLNDICGIRIICLFRTDLSIVDKIIRENFNVIGIDDKIHSQGDSLGYMSIHYICSIKKEYIGPRYAKIKNINFEIQTRTLSMHAWAVMSHYLDYKSEWDVPAHLKKSINALSGLFYVADSEFEQFQRDSEDYKRKTMNTSQETVVASEINLDTIAAYLHNKYTKRSKTENSVLSELVSELKRADYTNISDIDRDLERSYAAFLKYESDFPPGGRKNAKYADVGLVRISLAIASEKFLEVQDDDNYIQNRDIYKALVKDAGNS